MITAVITPAEGKEAANKAAAGKEAIIVSAGKATVTAAAGKASAAATDNQSTGRAAATVSGPGCSNKLVKQHCGSQETCLSMCYLADRSCR